MLHFVERMSDGLCFRFRAAAFSLDALDSQAGDGGDRWCWIVARAEHRMSKLPDAGDRVRSKRPQPNLEGAIFRMPGRECALAGGGGQDRTADLRVMNPSL